jgi:hypothetical protein
MYCKFYGLVGLFLQEPRYPRKDILTVDQLQPKEVAIANQHVFVEGVV